MTPVEQTNNEKELVAAWLQSRMGNWLRAATYVSAETDGGDMPLPPYCISKRSIEQYAEYCISRLATVAPGVDRHRPVIEISHDGHVTIAVV